MMHTGDQYEARARAARHYELRRLSKALAGLLFAHPVLSADRTAPRCAGANDQIAQSSRAA